MHKPNSKTAIDVVKSEGDIRNYRGLLLDNGMKILLVSDPTTDKAAAALDINIGSMSDPIPGLAHFCEHMLFLGTTKYPKENAYSKYLSQHNGGDNAYTSNDHTNYYFDVSPDFLKGALDRFAQFFLDPLFTETATCREMNAVHSEHSKNVACDSWRIDQLQHHISNPEHDYHKFGTGNLTTLDEIPKSKAINIREELLKFHKTWYSSNLMSLVVLGKEELDDLERMIKTLFENVENKNIIVPTWPEHPYLPNDNGTLTCVVPVKDIRKLKIIFPIPDSTSHYKSGPGQYLSHLIGHEGKGSLLSELKARKWCNWLAAGECPGAKGFAFFEVEVDLTEEGLDHINDILSLVFQYLGIVGKEQLQQWIFEECRDIEEMLFRFKDKEDPEEYVSELANRMHIYELEDVLKGPHMLTEWKPSLINDILSKLTPANVRVLAISQKFNNIATDSEPWYGTKYQTKPFTNDVINSWETVKPHENMQLPQKNAFIPADFLLVKRDTEDLKKMPSVVKDSTLSRVWFKEDSEYLLPKADLNFEIMSPLAYSDPFNANLSYMFVQLLEDDIKEYLYPAELAGMEYSISSIKYGLLIRVGGYHDKQKTLLESIFKHLTEYRVDNIRFTILKEVYTRSLKNFKMKKPIVHAKHYNNILLAQRMWTKEELLSCVEDMSASKLQTFISDFFAKIHIECLMFGNLTSTTALNYGKLVEDILVKGFGSKPLPEDQCAKDREYCLDVKTSFSQTVINTVHKTTSIENIYQVGVENTRDNMLLELFIQLIEEPCFDILRTQEQLGYIVSSEARRSAGTLGVRVAIQSNRDPKYLDSRIEQFMLTMRKFIEAMEDEDFETNKNGLMASRLEKPKKMSDRARKYWSEISSQQYNFNRDEIETNELKNITKGNILDFFDTYICPKSDTRKKLACYIIPSDTSEVKPETIPELEVVPNVVTDITSFKSTLSLYPVTKPMNNPKEMMRE